MNALAKIDYAAEAATPSEICAVVETTTRKRKAKSASNPKRITPSAPIAKRPPCLGNTDQQAAADESSKPTEAAPPPAWSSGHITLAPYEPAPEHTVTIATIQNLFRLRQNMIQAMTKLTLQAQSTVRLPTTNDDDFSSDEAKAAARKRTEKLYAQVIADPHHPLYENVEPFLFAMEPLEKRRAIYEKDMARHVKTLPIYAWAKQVKGLGDVSLANIIGACGDIGTYKSVSAVWKRMGLAVMNGCRQGNPGKDASKDDWIAHGYNKKRRSVVWNVGNSLILGMGRFRPVYGEDVDANEGYTYYQKVFANRARYEAERLPHKDGTPVKLSDKGKDSYTAHAANRAKRYVEKRLLKHLYLEWRRA
jgi:hypothetical protein